MSESKQMILDQRALTAPSKSVLASPKEEGPPCGGPDQRFKGFSVPFVAGSLPRNQFANRRTGARYRLLVSLDLRARSLFADRADAESDFLFFRAHLDDLEVVLDAGLKMQRLAVAIHGFRFVAQTFHPFGDLDKGSKCGHAQYFAVNHIADVMCLEESFPDVRLKLLHSQRQPPLVRFNGQHHSFHAIALLQHFRRMLHALGPTQVADVHQAVDAVLDFDKSSEIR